MSSRSEWRHSGGGGTQRPEYKPRPNTVSRISQFSKDGKFIKTWGKLGSGPGEFKTPHALAFDSRGRLFVADRGNNRVQVFEPDGVCRSVEPIRTSSDVHIDTNDVLYVADSESGPRYYPGWSRGVRIARARDGKVAYLVSPHQTDRPEGMSGGGVTVDAKGTSIRRRSEQMGAHKQCEG